jgi:hypothetical protein
MKQSRLLLDLILDYRQKYTSGVLTACLQAQEGYYH